MSDVPEGYKMSEVGVIPEEWEVKQFGDFAYLSKNYLNPQHSKKSYPCVELEHLTQETGLLLGFVESKEQLSQKLIFSRGDVLFGKLRPYLKKFYFAEFDGVCTSEIWVIKSYNNAIEQFIFHLIQSNNFLETANQTSGTKMPRADWKIVSCAPFPLPPLPEQQAIASALSDVDALITALEQLITKKRNIKQGAMQQLLTGEKRLPGFGGGWGVKKLGAIADVKTGPFGSSLHERDYVDDGTPIITVEHLGEHGVVHKNLPMVSDFDRKRLNAYALQPDDIVFSRVGSVDRNSLIKEKENGWLFSGRLLRIRLNTKYIFPTYLSYYFHQEPTKQRIRSVAVGQTMASLNTEILKNIEVALPPTKAEQTTIAQILSDMDTAIEALEQKRDKYKSIKQGMMQELLTGKIRLLKEDKT